MIVLNEQDLVALKNYANELPTKFGLGLLQFLETKEKEVAETEEIQKDKEEKPIKNKK
jgi:hypothetical protein